MYWPRYVLVLAAALSGLSFLSGADEKKIEYPRTKKVDQTDELHGVKVADPYRWLEQDVRKSKEVAEWVEAENKVTFGFLEKIPARKPLQKRITDLWNYERYSAPFKEGGRYFYARNDGLQNQAVIYVQDSLDSKARVLIDPNKLSKDGTTALSGLAVSPDGKYAAYGTADAGSDWNTWHVLTIEDGKKLDDELKWLKFSSTSWTKDGKGFYYSRFDEPKDKFTALNLNQKVYYHKIGTKQSEDELVYKRDDQPKWGFNAGVTDDGKYLVISTWKGTDHNNRVSYKSLAEKDAKIADLIDGFDNEYAFLDNVGSVFYFTTDLKAPLKRVVRVDVSKPEKEREWKEVIPEAKETLSSVSIVGNSIVCTYLKDASTLVKVFDLDGKHVRDVQLPGIGTAGGFGGKRLENETFYSFSSFATPPTIYRYDVKTGESKVFRTSAVKFDPKDYVVEQAFYKSKDGTKVPLFLTYKKGLKKDGSNPTILYGYGGFNISLTPGFSVSRLAWLEMGGIWAQANLRGGGEYGKEWHDAGRRAKKQNVFDDFIAAAEYLIDNKWTSKKRLAIKGGSNGGLLVGACMTQRPDLFGACLPAVGVMDMLRFHKFTAGRYWVDDYGSPDKKEDFEVLLKYSPYHNLKKGAKYPPTLITTADTDDRVVPGHSFKFAARLQEYQGGDAPVLIRIETKAGHGGGKPTTKLIEELTDEYAFLIQVMGLKYEAAKE
jgi:prolyl oligopeptidase